MLAVACLGAALFACTDNRNLTAPGERGATRLAFAPRYAYLGGTYFGEPINRIRLTARDLATDAVVGTLVDDVDPSQQNWELSLDVSLTGPMQVVVTIELINVTNGVESVQWSGETAPIDVTPSRTPQTAAPIQLFQGPPSNLAVTSVVITPGSIEIDEGATVTLGAALTGPQGAQAVWSSADPLVATVDQNGQVTALRDGTASIYAVAGPKADTATVRVRQTAASIELSPAAQLIGSIGQEAAFGARVLDRRGVEIEGAQVVWSVADSAVARHLGAGRFLARSNGGTDVTASSVAQPTVRATGRLTVSQRVARLELTPDPTTVTAIGATRAFTAVAFDATGHEMAATLAWRTSDPAVATVDETGTATATGAGTTEISVIAGTAPDTIVARATLRVAPAVASVEITPDSTTFHAIDDTVRLTAIARDANGNTLAGMRAEWSNRSGSFVTVDSDGLVRAIANGTAEIAARIGDVTGRALVIVEQQTAALSLLPLLDTIAVHDSIRFSARAQDLRGNVFTAARIVWRSSDTTIATVDSSGVARGRRAGNVTITARSNGRSASASLVVRDRLPARVRITPDSARINAIGYSTHLSVAVFDDLDNPLADTPVEWSSLDAGIATVDNTGLITAVAVGTARIVASVNPADTALITVRQVPAVLRVRPRERVLNAGDSLALTASVTDSNGVAIQHPHLTWQSSDSAVARVDTAGMVSARRNGAAAITATHGLLSAAADIIVNAADLSIASLTTVPADTFTDGGVVSFSLTVRNGGLAPAAASRMKLELLEADALSVMGDTAIALPAIAAGDSIVLTAALTLHGALPWPPAIKGRITLDADDAVPESDEANNQLTTAAHPIRFEIATVIATPDSLHFDAPGERAPLAVLFKDRLGRAIANRIATFTTSDSSVARVSAAGLVTARRPGTALVIVSAGGGADTVVVTVAPPNLDVAAWGANLTGSFFDDDSVLVHGWVRNTAPAPSRSFRYAVRLLDAGTGAAFGTAIVSAPLEVDGNDSVEVNVRIDGAAIDWPDSVRFELMADVRGTVDESSESDNIAVTSVQHVRYRVATLGLDHDALSLDVGAAHQLTASLADRRGRALDDRLVAFASRAADIASVGADGLITGNASGTAWIVAESEGVSDSVFVTVRAANLVVAALGVTPDTLDEGLPAVVSGTVRNTGAATAAASSARVRIRNAATDSVVVQFNVPVPALAPGDSLTLTVPVVIDTLIDWPDAVTGEVVLDAAGSVVETDESDNRAVSAAHVVRFRVATIDAAPDRLDLNTSVDTGRIRVTLRDRYGRVLTGRALTFVSRDPMVATVDGDGLVTGHGSGTTYVVAGAEARLDSVLVAVTGPPAQLLVIGGANQAGIVDQHLADSVGVQVVDVSGAPVADAEVTWTTDSGIIPASSRTNAAGITNAQWRLGRIAGNRKVTACVDALPCVEIHARAHPDRPSRGQRGNDSDDQLVTVAQVAPNALVLTVTDQFDNPTPDALVEWSVAPRHGTLSASSTVTDSLGVALVTWTMPTNRGTQLVHYAVKDNGVLVDSGTFRAHAQPDKPQGGRKRKGDDQYSTVGTVAGDSLILQVEDQYGNGVPDVQVNWTVNGGGSLDSSTTHTNQDGLTMVRLELGTVRGPRSVRADIIADGDVVASKTFRITGRPDKPNRHSKGAHADDQTVVVNQTAANALELTITDQYDNPVDSALVHWSLRSGHVDGALSNDVSMTDADGKAAVSWNVGKRAGRVFVDYVIFDADNVTPLVSGSFGADARPGARARVRVPHDSISSDALGDTTALTAETVDEFDNVRAGDTITWSGGDTLITVLPNGRVITKRNGRATAVATSGPVSASIIIGIRQRIRSLEIEADTLNALQINKRLRRIQRDRNGNQIDSVYHEPLVWSSSDTLVAKVHPATGVVTSVGPGFATITAVAANDSAVISSVVVQVRQRGFGAAPAGAIRLQAAAIVSESTHRRSRRSDRG